MSERHSGEPAMFIDRPNPIDPGFAGKLGSQLFLTRSRHVRYEIGRLKHFLNGAANSAGESGEQSSPPPSIISGKDPRSDVRTGRP